MQGKNIFWDKLVHEYHSVLYVDGDRQKTSLKLSEFSAFSKDGAKGNSLFFPSIFFEHALPPK